MNNEQISRQTLHRCLNCYYGGRPTYKFPCCACHNSNKWESLPDEGRITMREIHKGHRALNLKPLSHELTVVYINTIEDIYKAINARCFDIASRQIGINPDKIYDIYCDDEGLLKPDYYMAAYGDDDCVIVGDILIAKHNAQGEMIDLTQADIDYIGKQIWRTFDRLEREIDILFPISYPNYDK